MVKTNMLTVKVVYALPDKFWSITVQLPSNATIEQAIQSSDILKHCPEINWNVNRVGIFGQLATLDTQLQDNDRIEIYRPLTADPKTARRLRAAKEKVNR